jgi:long-subunit fatty acid transport protein
LLLLGLTFLPGRADAQDDLTAIYHNPAALAFLPGTRVSLCATAAFLNTSVRLQPWTVGSEGSQETFLPDPLESDGYYKELSPLIVAPIPFIGVSTNLFSERLVGALGIYVPNAAGATFGADQPSRYHIIEGYVISAFLSGALAYRLLDWLAVAAGGSVVYVRVNRRSLFYPVLRLSGDSGTSSAFDARAFFGSETEMELVGDDIRPAFHFGMEAWPHETVSVGFMMLSRYDVALEGPLTLKPGPGASLIDRPGFTDNQQRTEILAPWIFGIGANWDITNWLEIGAEFRYYLNSQVEKQVTTVTSEGELKDLLDQYQPEGFVTPKNLHDSYHIGAGFIVKPPQVLDLELMTGFHYEESPSPDNTVEVSAPSFDIAALHIGGRYTLAEDYALTLIYSHYRYLERTITDSITNPPTNFVGSGSNNQITVAFEVRVGDGLGVSSKAGQR